jgi:hypothetical protein
MMDDDWPVGARGVMKGVFWAIGFLKKISFIFFAHVFFMSPFGEKSPKKKP